MLAFISADSEMNICDDTIKLVSLIMLISIRNSISMESVVVAGELH